jgi:hypothetical protein
MSQNEPDAVEFEPVKLDRRRRRIDPVVIVLAVVVIGLAAAVLKPWGEGDPRIAVPPSSEPSGSPAPTPSGVAPVVISRDDGTAPTWVEIASVSARREEWGIRTIVLRDGSAGPNGTSSPYEELWSAASDEGRTDGERVVVDPAGGSIVALGLTFPPAETPLATRIWLRHEREWEWIDARAVDQVPGRGAYLYFRRDAAQPRSIRAWDPGRYRVDVLVGSGIRRIEVDVVGRSGVVPDPEPWAREPPGSVLPIASDLAELPLGPFVQSDGATVALTSAAGGALDEVSAWLDLDRLAMDETARSFVARVYLPRTRQLGVKLPPDSTIRSALLRRLAPSDGPAWIGSGPTIVSGDDVSFVSFGAPDGGADGIWGPGVYAVTVAWEDADGPHQSTWHVELRPGPDQVEPVLLAAARAWARFAGSSGVVMASSGTLSLHESFDGSNAIGCGRAGIRGLPTVIGLVGPPETDLTPLISTMLYPLADSGPLPVLVAAGAVPGLAVVAPVLTAEFGGPAAYGFRAGSGADAPGYTICIGLVPPAG